MSDSPDVVEQLRAFVALPETPGFPPRMQALSQAEASSLLAVLDASESGKTKARQASSSLLRAWADEIEKALAIEPLKDGGE